MAPAAVVAFESGTSFGIIPTVFKTPTNDAFKRSISAYDQIVSFHPSARAAGMGHPVEKIQLIFDFFKGFRFRLTNSKGFP